MDSWRYVNLRKQSMKQEVQLTSKALTVDELNNTDHVGFVTYDNEEKCYIVGLPDQSLWSTRSSNQNTFKITPNSGFGCVGHDNIKDALPIGNIKHLYRFDTRKELYQWLAED